MKKVLTTLTLVAVLATSAVSGVLNEKEKTESLNFLFNNNVNRDFQNAMLNTKNCNLNNKQYISNNDKIACMYENLGIANDLYKMDESQFFNIYAQELCSATNKYANSIAIVGWSQFIILKNKPMDEIGRECYFKILNNSITPADLYLGRQKAFPSGAFNYLASKFKNDRVIAPCTNFQNNSYSIKELREFLNPNVNMSCQKGAETAIFGYSDKIFTMRDALILNILFSIKNDIKKEGVSYNSELIELMNNFVAMYINDKKNIEEEYLDIYAIRTAFSGRTLDLLLNANNILLKSITTDNIRYSRTVKTIIKFWLSGKYKEVKNELEKLERIQIKDTEYSKLTEDEKTMYSVRLILGEIEADSTKNILTIEEKAEIEKRKEAEKEEAKETEIKAQETNKKILKKIEKQMRKY